ncbi:hypothetical protein B296_00052960 [Ensete ventricosum]|uniref:Cyclin-dependent kinase inhibitor n=1 Tax=Ensete ventricosum TaxID=4639 RepID=A0A426XKZ4_ENSVE|nr:hypothetical protein B296_00052960 [Ensete ventricosum]
MGKYTRKARVTGEVAVMEVSRHQSTNGVRTRARSLAAAAAAAAAADSSLAYLELRSRRLEKPTPPAPTSKPCKDTCKEAPKANADPRVSSADSGSVGSARTRRCSDKDEDVADTTAVVAAPDVEVSFGENVIDVEAKERCDFASKLRQKIGLCQLGFPKSGFFLARIVYNFDFVNECPLPGRYEWVKPDI